MKRYRAVIEFDEDAILSAGWKIAKTFGDIIDPHKVEIKDFTCIADDEVKDEIRSNDPHARPER